MKALVFDRFGSPDVLDVKELEKPVPKAGEVLIRTAFAAVNPIDAKIRQGTNFVCKKRAGEPFPWQLGFDCAGVVETAESSRFKPGDRVCGMAAFDNPNADAEYAVLPEDRCAKVPEGVPFDQAAALLTAGTTAQSIMDLFPEKGTVLVSGATGGVGHVLTQLLNAKGYEVTALCSEPNLKRALSLGAKAAFDYTKPLPQDLLSSFDAVADLQGGAAGKALFKALKKGGILVTVPTVTAEAVKAAAPAEIRCEGVLAKTTPEILDALLKELKDGRLKLEIGRVFQLEEAPEAHRLIEQGHTVGKMLFAFDR